MKKSNLEHLNKQASSSLKPAVNPKKVQVKGPSTKSKSKKIQVKGGKSKRSSPNQAHLELQSKEVAQLILIPLSILQIVMNQSQMKKSVVSVNCSTLRKREAVNSFCLQSGHSVINAPTGFIFSIVLKLEL